MFIEALFLITESWKPARCPKVTAWINCVAIQWNIINITKKWHIGK